jgi:hypothetical protein
VELIGPKHGESPLDLGSVLVASELRHPLDEQGEDAELDVIFDAAGEPVVHRLHLDPDSIESPGASLDHQQPLVARCSVL